MKKVRFGVIGLGDRGYGMLRDVIVDMKDVEVIAVSDVYADRIENAQKLIKEKSGVDAKGYENYLDLLKDERVEAVYVATSWQVHTEVAIACMEHGKIAGIEVGGANTIKELWDLVDAYERTKTPVMILENCCFSKDELVVTAMARDGYFGDIVHCSGAYGHDLRRLLADAWKNRNYRLDEYIKKNCENYPTHELGPIAKVLDINRGNRMVSLVSVASKSMGLKRYFKEHKDELDERVLDVDVKQGDIVNTIITCANGETISLRLDTTLPRYYSRDFTIRGTKGMYEQSPNSVFLDGEPEIGYNNSTPGRSGEGHTSERLNNANEYHEKYLPDYWLNIPEEVKGIGHGGIDHFMMQVFVDCIKNGEEMPIDVYDMASWMSVSCLSEISIAQGGMPQAIPDFTKGRWVVRKRKDVINFKSYKGK